ncbi:hypothetical protein [Azorhizobium doebereinerae]|uniref:hypothetical protein n=1 Tax=Azorhizobium doebereinerae TaxID=281091 RepID=UPI0012EB1460|nr:hypothetical protein [Azorhizobium doebereinerae]
MADVDPITEVSTAVQAVLRPFMPNWQFELVPSELTLTEFEMLMGHTPWVGFGWTGFEMGKSSGRQARGHHKMRLTIAVKNSDRPGRFLGDALGPGLYPAMATAVCVLQGKTLPGIGTISVATADQTYVDGYSDMVVALGVVDIEIGPGALGAPFDTLADAPDFAGLIATYVVADGATFTDTILLGAP